MSKKTLFSKFFNSFFVALIIFPLLLSSSFAQQTASTVKWNSKEGLQRLESSQYKNDFYQLAGYFQPQINPLYCSAASSVIILNAIADDNSKIPSQKDLEVTKPKVFGGGNIEFKSYSQITFFNDQTDKIKNRKIIDLKNITSENENDAKNFDPGVTLPNLRDILTEVYNLKVKMKYVDNSNEKTINKFRDLVKKVAADDRQYLIINFDGKVVGLKTNGHISPVAAFDANSDSLLILDVAGHKNGWYWVGVADLVKAMNSKDGQNYRGYLVVSKE